MAPRKQPTRISASTSTGNSYTGLSADVLAKRNQRHLDDLERSNYSDAAAAVAFNDDDDETGDGKTGKGRARQALSDQRAREHGGRKKKKSTMNVRSAILYRKNLATLIEESVRRFALSYLEITAGTCYEIKGITDLPPDAPTYLTAFAPPSSEPPRIFCSVCGYWGKYKCMRCAMPFCDLNCRAIHDETRCERRVV